MDFLDITLSVKDAIIQTSVYNKPTDSFNYLHYDSCHPSHTKNHIALSLAKRIIRITSEQRDSKLDQLKNHLEKRGHPTKTINSAYLKVFSPHDKKDNERMIVFQTTYNPSVIFQKKKIRNCLEHLTGDTMKETFKHHKIMITTRQPKSLRNLFIRSRFDMTPHKTQGSSQNENGLFCCNKCIYCREKYIVPTKEIIFGKYRQYKWIYRRRFTCNSVNVIYILQCFFCWYFYIGQTGHMKSRTSKHKSDILHPHNSFCYTLSKHLRDCSKGRTPAFQIFPIYYEDNEAKRRFIEKRFFRQYKPPLNSDR